MGVGATGTTGALGLTLVPGCCWDLEEAWLGLEEEAWLGLEEEARLSLDEGARLGLVVGARLGLEEGARLVLGEGAFSISLLAGVRLSGVPGAARFTGVDHPPTEGGLAPTSEGLLRVVERDRRAPAVVGAGAAGGSAAFPSITERRVLGPPGLGFPGNTTSYGCYGFHAC